MVIISIIICTYSINRYSDTIQAVNSIFDQTFSNFEVILVVDRNQDLHSRLIDYYNNEPRVKVILNIVVPGLSGSRNLGIINSNGEIIAFFDDDAIADSNWLKNILDAYKTNDRIIGLGGPILPLWLSGQSSWIPEEFYWTMGCTYYGFNNEFRAVRSNFGSNMSFKKQTFQSQLFNPKFGLIDNYGVGEELEFSLRVIKQNPKSLIVHNPKAIVYHKIFRHRRSFKHVAWRCLLYGKNINNQSIIDIYGNNSDDSLMRKFIIQVSIPSRLKNIFCIKNTIQMKFINLTQIIIIIILSWLIIVGMLSSAVIKS